MPKKPVFPVPQEKATMRCWPSRQRRRARFRPTQAIMQERPKVRNGSQVMPPARSAS
jgi:hypothetical protein